MKLKPYKHTFDEIIKSLTIVTLNNSLLKYFVYVITIVCYIFDKSFQPYEHISK